jgi:hypothetical protein|tara:strand:+ start:5476 stop:5895 length:420 start_codon:yes stop_codon:yes gene_type:complete
MKQNITAHGHANVLSTHSTTIEITKETELTSAGDCIIAIGASASCADLNIELRKAIQEGKKIKVTLKVGETEDVVTGFGNPELTLKHTHDIVIRKSDFKCSRTLMINSDKAACDLKPELIEKLKKPTSKLNFTIEVLNL